MERPDAKCVRATRHRVNKAVMTKATEWLMEGRSQPQYGLSTVDPSTLTGVD